MRSAFFFALLNRIRAPNKPIHRFETIGRACFLAERELHRDTQKTEFIGRGLLEYLNNTVV